jgi:hypothetical protein
MGMSMHDRYYEPEDDDSEDMDEYVQDWIKFEMRDGGYCDPKDPQNFYEACCELGLRDDLGSWEEATEQEKFLIKDYWLGVAEGLAEESYYESK